MKKFGVYCGRFNPMHTGHGAVVRDMIIQFGIENCMLVIGSCNAGFFSSAFLLLSRKARIHQNSLS